MLLFPSNIVFGRGRVFFDRFLDGQSVGEGERYIGNTTGFSLSRDIDEIECIKSRRGHLQKARSYVVREKLTGSFTTDAISTENVAAWFGDDADLEGVPAGNPRTETFFVKRGRYYQLGKTYHPTGVRHVEKVTFEVNGNPLDPQDELELSKADGRFYVLPGAEVLVDGAQLVVTFEWRQSPTASRTASKPKEVLGSLRFIADNPVGRNKDYFIPSAALKPTGDLSLKGDEWQQFGFDFEIRQLNPSAELLYVVEDGPAAYSVDEQAILDHSGITLDAFPYWENQLDIIINEIIASRGYLT